MQKGQCSNVSITKRRLGTLAKLQRLIASRLRRIRRLVDVNLTCILACKRDLVTAKELALISRSLTTITLLILILLYIIFIALSALAIQKH
jgi:hypothetical protein